MGFNSAFKRLSIFLLGRLIIARLINNFPTFYEDVKFISAFTTTRVQLILSHDVHSTSSHK